MTQFLLIPLWARLLLAGAMFLATLLLIALCSYDIILSVKRKRLVFDAVIFASYFFMLSYVTALAGEAKAMPKIAFPWICVLLLSLAACVYGTLGFIRNYIHSKNEILPVSIKQAFDNLNSGICFSDEKNRIILINYTLGELMYPILGSYPQTLDEIKTALNSDESVKPDESRSDMLYRFSDGRVWQFAFEPVSGDSRGGFVQTLAQDVTELFEANEDIESENEQLKITNEKITEMLEKLSDRIRQQETLALKMRVHNDIGSSLIKLSRIISMGADEDTEAQLRLLRSAVGYFATARDFSVRALDDVVAGAEEMNVKLRFDGKIPDSAPVQSLLALACRECVTNCVKHASGNEVYVKISCRDGNCLVSITNNGRKPEDKITEGGGLSSLRKRIEQYEGKMNILHSPHFELQLELPISQEGQYGV